MSAEVLADLAALRTQVRDVLEAAFPDQVSVDPPDVLQAAPAQVSGRLFVGVTLAQARPMDPRRNPSPDEPVGTALLQASVAIACLVTRQPSDRAQASGALSYDTALVRLSGILAALCAADEVQLVDIQGGVLYLSDRWWRVDVTARVASQLQVRP